MQIVGKYNLQSSNSIRKSYRDKTKEYEICAKYYKL